MQPVGNRRNNTWYVVVNELGCFMLFSLILTTVCYYYPAVRDKINAEEFTLEHKAMENSSPLLSALSPFFQKHLLLHFYCYLQDQDSAGYKRSGSKMFSEGMSEKAHKVSRFFPFFFMAPCGATVNCYCPGTSLQVNRLQKAEGLVLGVLHSEVCAPSCFLLYLCSYAIYFILGESTLEIQTYSLFDHLQCSAQPLGTQKVADLISSWTNWFEGCL